MPLEDLTGPNKYISDLVREWPLGTDEKSEGDDHIRGHKNVTRNTWPTVTGPQAENPALAAAGADALKVLMANPAGTGTRYEVPPGARLETVLDLNGVASFQVDLAAEDDYLIQLEDARVLTTASSVLARLSNDGGSSWQTGANSYWNGWFLHRHAGGTPVFSSYAGLGADMFLTPTQQVASAGVFGVSGWFTIQGHRGNANPAIVGSMFYREDAVNTGGALVHFVQTMAAAGNAWNALWVGLSGAGASWSSPATARVLRRRRVAYT